MIEWFGPGWDEPTPVGEKCWKCQRPFAEDDQGFSIPFIGGLFSTPDPAYSRYHKDCFIDLLGLKDTPRST